MKAILAISILVFFSGCSTNQKADTMYKIAMEISENGVVKSKPLMIVNGSERSSFFVYEDEKERLMEFQISKVKGDVYTLSSIVCDDVSDIKEEDLLKPLDCTDAKKMKITGKMNKNVLITNKHENSLRKFKVNVSKTTENELLEDF